MLVSFPTRGELRRDEQISGPPPSGASLSRRSRATAETCAISRTSRSAFASVGADVFAAEKPARDGLHGRFLEARAADLGAGERSAPSRRMPGASVRCANRWTWRTSLLRVALREGRRRAS